MNYEIIECDFNNEKHIQSIWILSKKNNFNVNDLQMNLFGKSSILKLFCSDEEIYNEGKKINAIFKENKNWKGFLLVKNNKVFGFIIYYNNENVYSNLDYLLIDKKYRNKGFSKLLINHLINNIKNNTNQSLIVCKSDFDKIDYYKKFNFVEIKDMIKNLNIKDKEFKDKNNEFIITCILIDNIYRIGNSNGYKPLFLKIRNLENNLKDFIKKIN